VRKTPFLSHGYTKNYHPTDRLGTNVEKLGCEKHVFRRISTGEFEPEGAEGVSYRRIGLEHFNTTAAQELALDTARQSVVLMKNDAATLPIGAK
jgi:beta-glucosidase-like glycosyl hydrolase